MRIAVFVQHGSVQQGDVCAPDEALIYNVQTHQYDGSIDLKAALATHPDTALYFPATMVWSPDGKRLAIPYYHETAEAGLDVGDSVQ